jgi:hypothetical protein
LIIRAWVTGGPAPVLRIRVLRVPERGGPSITAATSVDKVCGIVRNWLGQMLAAAQSPPER